MIAANQTTLGALESVAGDIFDRWDRDQRAGKLLTALSGRMGPGYDPRVDQVRAVLAQWPAVVAGLARIRAAYAALLIAGANGAHDEATIVRHPAIAEIDGMIAGMAGGGDAAPAPAADGWRPGGFEAHTDTGKVMVAGWVRGHFALDFRIFRDDATALCDRGWQLTHVPTGMVAAGIIAPLSVAIEVADEMAAAADWNFTDPAEARARGAAAMAVITRNDDVASRRRGVGPLFEIDAAREEKAA